MATECIAGPKVMYTQVCGSNTLDMAWEIKHIPMDHYTRENGKITNAMVPVNSGRVMAISILVSTKWARNMVMESSCSQVVSK